MSEDLVELVQKAISKESCDFYGAPADMPQELLHWGQARVAIAAVLDFLSDPGNVTDEMIAALERETFLGNGPRRALAVVLRAARTPYVLR